MASKPAVRPPPPIGDDTGEPKLKVAAGTGGGGGEIASPLEAKWTIHAVNVQQGDAILLDLQYGDTGKGVVDIQTVTLYSRCIQEGIVHQLK